MVDADLEFPASHETDVIIRPRPFRNSNACSAMPADVIVKLSDSQISFTVGDNLLASKLIEGNYPNTARSSRATATKRVVIGREALLETVRRVSLLSSDNRRTRRNSS